MLLKGIIVYEEEKAKGLRMKLQEGEIRRYVEVLELYSGVTAIGALHARSKTNHRRSKQCRL